MIRKILQISDCHLVASGTTLLNVDTQASLEAVLGAVLARANPDAIIASGDLAHDPYPQVYARFLATVRSFSDAPLLCLPGNHDVLASMRAAALPETQLTVGPWLLAALDSHEDEAPGAQIDAADRDALAAALEDTAAAHVLVATHHPLVAINCPWLDRDRIQNGPELIEWLSECSAVHGTSRLRGVVFGHAHQPVEDHVAGVPVWGAPSTCFQFQPRSETFTLDGQPPGWRWLYLADDGAIMTEVERAGNYSIMPRAR